MYSIGFPKIFNGSRIKLNKDYDAIKNNLKALLSSDKGSLFGDPYYGVKLRELLWNQAHESIIKNEIIDDVFEAIYSYMPQITVNRNDITIQVQNKVVVVTIKVSSDSGIESNLYEISLLTEEDN